MNSEDSDCCTEDQLYEVEEIVDKKISKGRIKYYVKWVGYDNAQNTWEPKDHLPLEMVEEFEEKLRNNRKEKISKSSTNSLLNKKREKQKEEKTVNKKENKSEDNKQFLTEENHPNFSESVNKNTLKSKIKSLRVNAPLPEKYNSLTHESDTLEGGFKRDSIEKIVDIKVYKGKKLSCEVEWKNRSNNIKPKNSFYLYDVIYENYPKLLLDFIIKSSMVVEEKEENLIDLPKEVRENYI